MIERKMSKNRGYSLIELIVVLAIAAVLVIIVGSIMVTSAGTYSRANAETSVQSRAQIVMNQINDLVIDTTGKADYGYSASGGSADKWGNLTDDTVPATATAKTLRLFNDDKIYDVEWLSGGADKTGRLIYREYDTSDGENPSGSGQEEILSEGVESFSCDLSSLSSNRIVGVDMVLKKGERRYHAYKNISIRNPIFAVGQTVSSADAVKLVITNDTMTVEPNQKYTMYGARVRVISGTPSTEVIYKVVKKNGKRDNTKILDDNKTLQIDTWETSDTIEIQAIAAADSTQVGTIVAYVRRVDSLGEASLTSSTGAFTPGAELKLEVPMDYSTGASDSAAEIKALKELYIEVRVNNNGSWEPTTFPFTIPTTARDGDRYDFRISAARPDARLSSLGKVKYNYYYNSKALAPSFYVDGAAVTVPSVSTRETAIYRGLKTVTLSGNAFQEVSLPTGYTMTEKHYFFYRPKEYRATYKQDYYNSLNGSFVWSEKLANVSSEEGLKSAANSGKWVQIFEHTDTSFTVPDEIYKTTPINRDYRFQLALVARVAAGEHSAYVLCGQGEFYLPGYKVTIDNKTASKQTYRIFELAGDNSFPAEDDKYIKVGQLERAFNRVVIDNGKNSIGEYDGKLEIFANSNSNKTLGNAKKLNKSDYELVTVGDNVMDTSFRLNDLSKQSFFKYPDSTATKWNDYNTYWLHVVHSFPYMNDDKYLFESSIKDNTEIYNWSSGPYIELQLRRGNAKVSYRRWKEGTDPNTRKDNGNYWTGYNDRAAYIPAPGSSDDLLNQYSLKQLSTTWRPAGSLQPVYINTFKEDWKTQQEEPYLIQMKVDDGKRYLRMWYADPDSVKTYGTGGKFTANKWYYVGEYVYNSDTKMWDYRNNREPTTY
ncbi:MAG: type II secretion system protein [Lachnospiraceae bacterium]|nr:type II secretion system protein [Lachnospiraceae bacterium]